MQKETLPSPAQATCDTQVLNRIVEFGRKRKINGTPTIITSDGVRVPGAINTAQMEKLLSEGKF
jgi:thiol:disulfide interchange protein DsbC